MRERKIAQLLIFCTLYALILIPTSCTPRRGAADEVPSDPGWPRIVETDEAEVVIYQPQVDTWKDYIRAEGWVAVEATLKGSDESVVGSVRMSADTETDFENRTVLVYNKTIHEINLETDDKEIAQKIETMLRALEMSPEVISLDRVLAMAEEQDVTVEQTQVSVEPPVIFYSKVPAILVVLDGEPLWSPIENTDLKYAVNTNWDLFLHEESGTYYLLDDNRWLMAPELEGSWKQAEELPEGFTKIPDDENWSEVRANVPATKSDEEIIHAVFVNTKPAELIITDGDPEFEQIGETELRVVSNTESDLFLHSGNVYYYYLVSGRWFRSRTLTGTWAFATDKLPEDFALIPEDHSRGYVLASVPGTKQANEAVIQAQIPQTAEIDIKEAEENIEISYDGEPEFESIDGTDMSYAVNTQSDVVYVNNNYYLCSNAAWFYSPYPQGPWRVCTVVPSVIYGIPSRYPIHHVTYVRVYGYTSTRVTFGYTGGYMGIYVSYGVPCYGTGWYYRPYYRYHPSYRYPIYYPYPYTYGARVRYNPYTGRYTRSATVYGPYGGAGRYATYNPRTGSYSRGRAAWGPYGGTREAVAYNPRTGTRAATRQSYNQYAQWGQSAVVTRQGEWAKAKHYTDSKGSRYGFETSRGTKGAGYAGKDSRGAVARHGDDLYVGKDGKVFKRDETGWQKREGGSWTSGAVPSGERSEDRQMPRAVERPTAPAQMPSRQPAATQRPAQTPTRPPATSQRPAAPSQTPGRQPAAPSQLPARQPQAVQRPQTGVQPRQQTNRQYLNQSHDARNRGTQRTQRYNSYQQQQRTTTRQQPRRTGGARR
jgi:hypothetical protein